MEPPAFFDHTLLQLGSLTIANTSSSPQSLIGCQTSLILAPKYHKRMMAHTFPSPPMTQITVEATLMPLPSPASGVLASKWQRIPSAPLHNLAYGMHYTPSLTATAQIIWLCTIITCMLLSTLIHYLIPHQFKMHTNNYRWSLYTYISHGQQNLCW